MSEDAAHNNPSAYKVHFLLSLSSKTGNLTNLQFAPAPIYLAIHRCKAYSANVKCHTLNSFILHWIFNNFVSLEIIGQDFLVHKAVIT